MYKVSAFIICLSIGFIIYKLTHKEINYTVVSSDILIYGNTVIPCKDGEIIRFDKDNAIICTKLKQWQKQ